jgi:colanic acid biosynthesis glycosyl transferase WcaI
MKAWRRVLFDSTFAVSSFLLTLRVQRPDVVLAVSPPLQTALSALALKARWRRPIFLWVQDIVPDAALGAGMMKPGSWLRIATWMERLAYDRADQIGVIGPGFIDNLDQKRVPRWKMVQVPNWADLSRFSMPPSGESVRHTLGYTSDDFLVIHAGSVAGKQCLENAVRAIKILDPRLRVNLLIVGDGSRMAAVQNEVERLQVAGIRFLAPITGAPFIELLRAADALLLNQCKDVTDMVIPSKLLTYLPSAKPIIAAINLESEAARFLQEAGSAVIVQPDDPGALARGIAQLIGDQDLQQRLGAAGFRYVRNLDRERALPRFADLLHKLARSGQFNLS